MTIDKYYTAVLSIIAASMPKWFFEGNDQKIEKLIFESYSFGELPDEAATQVINFYENHSQIYNQT